MAVGESWRAGRVTSLLSVAVAVGGVGLFEARDAPTSEDLAGRMKRLLGLTKASDSREAVARVVPVGVPVGVPFDMRRVACWLSFARRCPAAHIIFSSIIATALDIGLVARLESPCSAACLCRGLGVLADLDVDVDELLGRSPSPWRVSLRVEEEDAVIWP